MLNKNVKSIFACFHSVTNEGLNYKIVVKSCILHMLHPLQSVWPYANYLFSNAQFKIIEESYQFLSQGSELDRAGCGTTLNT